MEKNYINWPGRTHFYVDIQEKTYGVRVNVNESDNAENIIRQGLEKYKQYIDNWKKEWKKEEGVA